MYYGEVLEGMFTGGEYNHFGIRPDPLVDSPIVDRDSSLIIDPDIGIEPYARSGTRRKAASQKSPDRHKDKTPLQENQIEIGTSLYTFSEQAQTHFFRIDQADLGELWIGMPRDSNPYTDYKRNRSVLSIHDAHSNPTGQFRLYKGLEIFFRDNPRLIGRTIFLAEGYPASQPVSLQSLIEQEPNPSDKLIKEVLGSFLITGYMAYEWKHRQGIPIIGIEDPLLYAASRDYLLISSEHPEKIFFSGPIEELDEMMRREVPSLWQDTQRALHGVSFRGRTAKLSDSMSITISDRLVWNFTYGAALSFFGVARNNEMARTLIQQSRMYENPLLFAGGGHFGNHPIDFEFNAVKLLISKLGPSGLFGRELWLRSANAVNLGIYHYLRDEKIGFTLLDPEKLGDPSDAAAYNKLFLSQQNADRRNMSYDEYVNWLLGQRGMNRGITVRPSPETAAELVRRLKEKQKAERQSGVVYEAKGEGEERPHWIKTSRQEVWDAIVKDTIWAQPSHYQGVDFEQVRNVNLGSNCPHIDDIVLDAGTVTQHKSMDLTAKTYQNIGQVDYWARKYIDTLDETTQGRWTWYDKKNDKRYEFKRGDHFQDRYLELGIPLGKATPDQVDKLLELQEYAQTRDVTLVIVEVP